MTIKENATAARLDPLPVLKGLVSLRRLAGTYPSGHPMIVQKLHELDDAVRQHLLVGPELRIDLIHGNIHLDGVSFEGGGQVAQQIGRELTELGIDSLYIKEGEIGRAHV